MAVLVVVFEITKNLLNEGVDTRPNVGKIKKKKKHKQPLFL